MEEHRRGVGLLTVLMSREKLSFYVYFAYSADDSLLINFRSIHLIRVIKVHNTKKL